MKTIMKIMVVAAVVAAANRLGGAPGPDCGGGDAVYVRSASLAVGVNPANGRIVSLKATNGVEFAAKNAIDIFRMEMTRRDDFSASAWTDVNKAKRYRTERLPDGVKLVWEDVNDKLACVECTVRAAPDDPKVRFGISFAPTNGWAVIATEYPRLRLSDRIGDSPDDDCLLIGGDKGGIVHAPGTNSNLRTLAGGMQPGSLAVQAALWWDPSTLFYFAAEDDKGDVKTFFALHEKGDTMMFRWNRRDFDAAPMRLDYDFTIAALCGSPDDPVTWHDGADLYRDWARHTRFCKVPTAQRKDLPKWMTDAPALTLFKREWFDRPDMIRRWVKDCWERIAPGVPLVVAAWGWEHFYTWVHPYFPCNPSDGEFTSLVKELEAVNVHMFPWPSGYHWTLTYGKNADGTFLHDWRADFAREAAAHACMNRDGKLYERVPGFDWLKGGSMAAMCGGEEWTQKWWNNDVTAELARRGCRIIQADQNNGGAFPPCWNTGHPHPPGEGRWKTESARRQMKGMVEAIRKIHGEGVATFETANEQMNDLVGIILQRDTRPKMEWANLYGYLYHEYVPIFQPNPERGCLRWMAYSAAEGHMPRFVPLATDFETDGLAMPEGFLSMTFGGDGTNRFHTGQNVLTDDALFTPGTRFRLTASCRTLARSPNGEVPVLSYGIYTRELKTLASGRFSFPKTVSDERQAISSEFTMPEGPAQILRVMLNASPGAKGEVADMKLEVVEPDGTLRPARFKGSGWHNDYMRRWVELHRGEGRPWLAHGRRVKPPRLECEMVEFEGKVVPAVFIAAYESLDGRRAFVLANATEREQDVRCLSPGRRERSFHLAPRELRLVKSEDRSPPAGGFRGSGTIGGLRVVE